MMKITKVMSYLLSIVVLISIAIGVNGCMSEQEEILEYLEEKYGQQFEVERYWSEYDGSYTSYKALVYPKDKSQTLLEAGKYWDRDENEYVFWDSYVQSKWSAEFTETHKTEVTALDQRDMTVAFTIGLPGDFGRKESQISLNEYLRNTPDDIKPSARIAIAIKADKVTNLQDEVKLVQSIYAKLKTYGFKNFYLSVIYVKPDSFGEIREVIHLKQVDPTVSLTTIGQGKYHYVIYLNGQDTMNSPDDILDRFQTGE